MKKASSLKRIPFKILPIVLMVIASILAYRLYFDAENEEVSLYYAEVVFDDFDVMAKVSGEIVDLYVDEGDAIKKGQLIGKIDDTERDYFKRCRC